MSPDEDEDKAIDGMKYFCIFCDNRSFLEEEVKEAALHYESHLRGQSSLKRLLPREKNWVRNFLVFQERLASASKKLHNNGFLNCAVCEKVTSAYSLSLPEPRALNSSSFEAHIRTHLRYGVYYCAICAQPDSEDFKLKVVQFRDIKGGVYRHVIETNRKGNNDVPAKGNSFELKPVRRYVVNHIKCHHLGQKVDCNLLKHQILPLSDLIKASRSDSLELMVKGMKRKRHDTLTIQRLLNREKQFNSLSEGIPGANLGPRVAGLAPCIGQKNSSFPTRRVTHPTVRPLHVSLSHSYYLRSFGRPKDYILDSSRGRRPAPVAVNRKQISVKIQNMERNDNRRAIQKATKRSTPVSLPVPFPAPVPVSVPKKGENVSVERDHDYVKFFRPNLHFLKKSAGQSLLKKTSTRNGLRKLRPRSVLRPKDRPIPLQDISLPLPPPSPLSALFLSLSPPRNRREAETDQVPGDLPPVGDDDLTLSDEEMIMSFIESPEDFTRRQ